jgi:hypothetical protein
MARILAPLLLLAACQQATLDGLQGERAKLPESDVYCTRHPDDVLVSVSMLAPRCIAGEAAPLLVSVRGLRAQACYALTLTVNRGAEEVARVSQRLAVDEEEEDRAQPVYWKIPPLVVAAHSLRVSVEDWLASTTVDDPWDALLATHIQKMNVLPVLSFEHEQHSSIRAVAMADGRAVAHIFFSLRPPPLEEGDGMRMLEFRLNGEPVASLELAATRTECGWRVGSARSASLDEDVFGCNGAVIANVGRVGVTNLLEARLLGTSMPEPGQDWWQPVSLLSFVPSTDEAPEHQDQIIVFLFLNTCEMTMDTNICFNLLTKLSPVLKSATEVRVLFAFLITHDLGEQIKQAIGGQRVTLIGVMSPDAGSDRVRHVLSMDSILITGGGVILLMEDGIEYPSNYLDVVTAAVSKTKRSVPGNFAVGSEGYVLSAALDADRHGGCKSTDLDGSSWVHVLRLGTIAFPARLASTGFANSLMHVLDYRPIMRHLGFAYLAESNDVPLLLGPSMGLGVGDAATWQLQSWLPQDALFRFQPSDFVVRPHYDGNEQGSVWRVDGSAWAVWLRRSYREVSFSSMLANAPDFAKKLDIGLVLEENVWGNVNASLQADSVFACQEEILNIPVMVMSQPHDLERRSNSQRLLKAIGFRNVTFPPTIKWTDVDVEQMKADGILWPAFFRRLERSNDTNFEGYLKYAANAVSQIRQIRAAAAANEHVIIMEDDFMLGSSIQRVREHLCALRDLPLTADMVYLEYCLETCAELSYDSRYPKLARARKPACSGAIFFTAKGAQRVADLCWPVFDVIDRMYPILIQRGWLEAYILTPAAFYQV